MKTLTQMVSAAFLGLVLLTSQAFAAGGSLYPLDPWNHTTEGHMSSEQHMEDEMDRDMR